MSIVARKATLLDIDWICERMPQVAKIFPSKKSLCPKDPLEIRRKVEALVDLHIVIVAVLYRDGIEQKKIGFLAGLLCPHWMNPEEIKTALTCFWWVDPEYRGSRAAFELLNDFESEAKACRCDWVVMSIQKETPVRDESLHQLGYNFREITYMKEFGD